MAVCVGRGVWDGRIVGITVAVFGGEDVGAGAQFPIMHVKRKTERRHLFINSLL